MVWRILYCEPAQQQSAIILVPHNQGDGQWNQDGEDSPFPRLAEVRVKRLKSDALFDFRGTHVCESPPRFHSPLVFLTSFYEN